MSNRLSWAFSRPPCRCQRIKRRLARLHREAKRIEPLMGCAEFLVPSVGSYMSGDRRSVRLFLTQDFDEAPAGADLAQYAAGQLRTVAMSMLSAADRLEATGGAA